MIKAAIGDSVEGIEILLRSGADLHIKDYIGNTALEHACAWGSVNAAKVLIEAGLPVMADEHAICALHACIVLEGSPEVVRCLTEAASECVNAVFRPPLSHPLTVLFTIKGWQHRFAEDRMSRLAYHIFGASSLTIAVLAGRLDIADILLDAKADLTLCNSRGKTVRDLSMEARLPASFLRRLSPEENTKASL